MKTSDKLKVLDLFSGIGGFSLGLERTGGFETVAFCEIEKFSNFAGPEIVDINITFPFTALLARTAKSCGI